MHSNAADTPTKRAPIVVGEYSRMETGGWIALGLGIIGAAVLLTVGFTTHVVLPTGTAALTMGLFLSGCILLVGRLVLRKQDQMRVELEEHRAEHQAVMLDAEDIATIRKQVADALAIIARWDLERAQERKVVAQVEEFLAWRERAAQRAAERRAADGPSAAAWASSDEAWLGDVAEAFELGKQMGPDPDPNQDQQP